MPLPLLAILSLTQAAPEIHAYAWSPIPEDCRHITRFVWFNKSSQPADVAAETRTKPEGRRALFSWDMHRDLLTNPEDVCRTADGQPTEFRGVWPEHGIATNQERFTQFFHAFKEAGGQMDWFVLDFEGGYSNWHLGGGEAKEPMWRAIQNDPRFPDLAKKLGFDDLMTVCYWPGKSNYLKWNAVMGGVIDAALQQAIFEPAATLFPGLHGSNYGGEQIDQDQAVPDLNGHRQWRETELMGTHNAPSLYTTIGQLGDRMLDGEQPYGRTPLAGLRLALNRVRAIQRCSDKPISPWIAWQRYAGDGENRPPATVGKTPYYQELVYHLALAGCDTFLFWNPHPWRDNQDPESLSTAKDEHLLDDLLDDLNQRLAGETRECVTTEAVRWNAMILATGLRVDDHIVWRITVPEGTTEVHATVAGKEVTIPVDGVGAWYRTAAGQPLKLAPER